MADDDAAFLNGAFNGVDAGVNDAGDATQWPSFSLRANSARALFAAVSAVYNHRKDQYATLAVNAKGLRVVCENTAKSLHAIAYVSVGVFDEFDLPLVRGPATEVAFRCNVKVLLECLAIYSAAALATTVVALKYDAGGDGQLLLLLEHGGVVTECRMRTVDLTTEDAGIENGLEAAFQRDERPVRIVMLSDALYDVIKDIADAPGATTTHISTQVGGAPGSGVAPLLRFHASSPGGSLTADVPGDSDAVLSASVTQELNFNYGTRLLEASLRALGDSTQTMLRINTKGVLSITHELGADRDGTSTTAAARGGAGSFVSFLITADEPEGEPGESGTVGGAAGAAGDGASHSVARRVYADAEGEAQSGVAWGGGGEEEEEDEGGGGARGGLAGRILTGASAAALAAAAAAGSDEVLE